MGILASDIKLLASERMTDTTDGGGRRTSNVIVDGVPGNIFPKVSRLDSVYGRVNMRKVFSQVDTANTDTYAGAHAAIIDAAQNDKIKVSIFSTGSDFDTRTDARNRVESYVISGPASRMVVYGRQLVGQQAVTVLQRVEEPLPDVGEVFCLSNESGGIIASQQYIRIADVTHEVRTFTDSNGDFQRRIVTLKIASPLLFEFVGLDSAPRVSSIVPGCILRSTTVADAARYFGITPMSPALAGALTVTVDSIFLNIVPTNTREVAVNNAQISGTSQVQPAALVALPYRAVGVVFPSSGGYIEKQQTIALGQAVAPGTLNLVMGNTAGGSKSQVMTDDGKGGIPSGQFANGVHGGTVDYGSGVITVSSNWGDGQSQGTLFASYVPAVQVGQAAHLRELPVTLATRGTVQVMNLNPLPAKGTVFVDYRALGKWYRLQGDGLGKLAGTDPAYGTGTVDFTTGALVVTLGALPDVGSSVIIGWGSTAHYTLRVGATADAETVARQSFTLTALPIKPGTLSISYVSGVTTYTATADAAGNITGGNVTGTVNMATGEVSLVFGTRLPNVGTALTVSYSQETPTSQAAPTTASGTGNFVSWASPNFATAANVQTKGLRVLVPFFIPASNGQPGAVAYVPANDDALGNLITMAVSGTAQGSGYSHAGGAVVGTVNYSTGTVTLDPNANLSVQRSVYDPYYPEGGSWKTLTYTYHPALGDYPWTVRTTNASSATVLTSALSQTQAPVVVDLTATVAESIVPGSVNFTAFGKTYFDRNGLIYHTIQADGTGTLAGSIDYSTGKVTLTDYTNGATPAITVLSCLTKHGEFTSTKAVFRTAGSPLRPASTFIQVIAADGATLTATCDQNGKIVGDYARGTVNQQFGLVSIEWGQMVAAAGNETQEWYSAANVVAGMIWKPREVMPGTITYSTVVLSSLPVDSNILGLDPVRLPTDGRVPIFRAGDVVLVHNTKTTALPNPVVAGSTYNVGRTNLADLVLYDAAGTLVPTTQYAVDLAGGNVIMAANMNLGALVQPLSAKHRIEELTQTTDAQINGQVTLSAPLSRDFDADTKVSSCLLFGDLFARVSNIFDQVSWTSEWSNARIGTNATPEFNSVSFPITVTNKGAVTERWRVNFTSTTAFQVVGENVGVIATGATNADCSPINPLTGQPYFTIPAAGWGIGWAVGNQLRFNTIGATGSVWMVRTVLPGAALSGDSIDMQVRGDVDA